MKLLLDENLPHQMRSAITGHEVFTVAFMGWSGVENGELLELASRNGFDALISNDRGLEYEQNHDRLPLAVVVVLAPTNTMESLRPLIPKLLTALDILQPCQFVTVQAS
jgi:hypothetical protein